MQFKIFLAARYFTFFHNQSSEPIFTLIVTHSQFYTYKTPFCTYSTTSFGLVLFQVLNSYMRPAATTLNNKVPKD